MDNSFQPFLITGMARSGTTLLDRMLNSHPQISAISQPLPKLYRFIKAAFLDKMGYENDHYVLGDLFLENRYSRKDFLEFLNTYTWSKTAVQEVLESMKGWSGQTHKVNEDYLLSFDKPLSLADFYNYFLKEYKGKGNIAVGTKEIIIEEFIEYYLQEGVKIILIIRDPRDVLTSLNFGKGPEYGGVHRPTLFHLRNWRKSISIANTFMHHPSFYLVKYEDLIRQPIEEMNGISDFLGVLNSNNSIAGERLLNSDGSVWQGNSSTGEFSGVNSSNSKKYKKYLSAQTIEYVEHICKFEMQLHGYELENKNPSADGFHEPFVIGDCGLDKAMSTRSDELSKELHRTHMLKEGRWDEKAILSNFYSPENYTSLKEIIRK